MNFEDHSASRQRAIFRRACYFAGIAVSAVVCGMDLLGADLFFGHREGLAGQIAWRPIPSSVNLELNLRIMTLAGLISTRTGSDKRVGRPSGADYIFRAHQDLLVLSNLIDEAYEREWINHDPRIPALDREAFRSLKFEEAWSEAIARLTQPPCVRAVKRVAQILIHDRSVAGQEVKRIVMEEAQERRTTEGN
jgi:hypothetical protein